ncbi:MAG TPA: hypothetical protein VGB85_02705 [Nannocystis sp.]|jgi:hypothetical protein
MPTKSRRCYAFAVLVLPLAFGGLPVQARAFAPGPLPNPTAAATAERDVVYFQNGGMVLGQIVEILPGDSLTMVTTAGDRKRFTWAELASYERNGVKTEVPAEPAVPAAAADRVDPPEPIQLRSGAPRLHIELTRPVDLKLYEVTGEFSGFNYRGFSTGTTSRPVCVAPCDQVVDGHQGQSFFFNGDGVVKSRDFSLSDYGGDVVVRVKPGSSGLRVGGIVVMSLGGAGLAGGTFLLLTAKNGIDQEYDDMNRPLPLAQPNYVPATALLISGALVVAGGLAMLLLSRTKVHFSQRTAAAKRRLGLG